MNQMHRSRSGSRSVFMKAVIYVITMLIIVYVIVFLPTPYMINRPGTAEEIKPIVTVMDGDAEEEGSFMLTTVSVSYANLAMLATSIFDTHAEVVRKQPDRNHEEYETQQSYYMSSSQSNAIMAAYNRAGVKYAVVPEYVFVVGLSKTSPPKGDLRSGDIIRKVNDQTIHKFEDLSSLLQKFQAGDTVTVQLERSGKLIDGQMELVEIISDEGVHKPGLGISIGEVRNVKPSDAGKEVKFAKTGIGGPSAGLMFTLEIYNQLTPGDLSRGYHIAGTGTISEDGTVGSIGGIQFKIVASNRKKAELFFVPEQNYKDAKAKADEIGSTMKLIPVKRLDDALQYLDNLEPKV